MITPEQLRELMGTTAWTFIGSGTYNRVYVSNEKLTIEGITHKWVKKVGIERDYGLTESKREVRKFIQINGLPAYELSAHEWLGLYVGTSAPSDQQTAEAVLDIFRRTGNIIVDGCGEGNFLLYEGTVGEPKPVLVDVDFARRRGSVISDDPRNWNWPDIYQYLDRYTFSINNRKPLTTSVIRTLLWLEKCLSPEQIQERYSTPAFIKRFRMICHLNLTLTQGSIDRLFDLPESQFSRLVWQLESMQEAGIRCTTLTEEEVNLLLAIQKDETDLNLELFTMIQSVKWIFLKEDTDNKVFISEDSLNINGRIQKWIKTECKNKSDEIHNSFRVVKKWNILHPENPAFHLTEDIWFAPDLGDMQASDEEIAAALLKMYKNNRSLVTNACEPGTFIVHEGQVRCKQVGYIRNRDSLDNTIPDFWNTEIIEIQLSIWKHHPTAPKPLTVSMLRTLIYLDNSLYLQGPIKDEYLVPKVLFRVRALRLNEVSLTVTIMEALLTMSEEIFNRLIIKLIILWEDFRFIPNEEEIEALIKILHFDALDEIPNDYLSEFIEAQLSTAPAHKLMHLAVEFCLLNVIKVLALENPSLLEVKEPEYKQTPLIIAVLVCDEEIARLQLVQYFISQGVRLNEQIKCAREHRFNGFTALDCARRFGPEELVSMLVEAGALSRSQLPGSVVLSAISIKVATATEIAEQQMAIALSGRFRFFPNPQADSRSATPIPEKLVQIEGVLV